MRAVSLIVTALAILDPGPARADRPAIVPSLELAVLQPPALVTILGTAHLVYELHITNLAATDVELTRIDVLDGERAAVLGAFHDQSLREALGRPGLAASTADRRLLGAGLRAVLYTWLPVSGPIPTSVAHRLEFDVVRPTGREHVTMQGGRASPHRGPGLVLGLPVRAGRWVAVYGPSAERGHRRFLYTVDGRARIPARFAIDWLKLGDDDAFSHGDPTQLTNWYGYGADVLAVADATVADARDDIAADTPVSSSAPAPIALENASGNYVVLDLGGGRYAFYEHLKPGPVRVVPGARVRRGDVIGLLGNTGSSSAGPHLHFHIADTNASLGAEGVPYGFDRFDSLGEYQFADAATGAPARISPRAAGAASTRRRELPAPNAVVRR